MTIFLTFSPSFVLLTISYEGLFYVFFSLTLYIWLSIERIISPSHLNDLRISLFFFFLLQSAFFSTGNIASISSFSLDSVYRLIPVFDPFAMGAILVFKLMVPFILLSAALGGVKRKSVGVWASAVSDVLTLNFFWLVKDEGSWLEIGSTISNFIIGGLLGVFITGLELGSGVFTGEQKVDAEVAVETAEVVEENGARRLEVPPVVINQVASPKKGNGKAATQRSPNSKAKRRNR